MTSGARSMGGAHPPRRPPLLRRGQPAARHSASSAGPRGVIVILALGLLERDGVALSIGLFVGFLALVIVFLALAVLAAVLHGWFAQ